MVEFQVTVEEILSLCKLLHCLTVSERYLRGPLPKALPVFQICHQSWKRMVSLKTFEGVEWYQAAHGAPKLFFLHGFQPKAKGARGTAFHIVGACSK